MQTLGRWAVLAAILVGGSACDNNRGSTEQCANDTDCAPYFCLQGTCVQCGRDTHCDIHRICGANQCVLLGAEDESHTLNAHGNWDGTPGTPGYQPLGTCTTDGDCGFGEVCNPFTAGCIKASDFADACGLNDRCDGSSGPNGVVTACEPMSGKCYPAPLCASEHNCQGYGDDFVCDPSGVCQFRELDCTPPADIPEPPPCPFEPALTDECNAGLFCSPLGRCVQCTCDGDCGTTGGLPICYVQTGRCVPTDFCTSQGECSPEDCDAAACACDTRNQVCKAYCDQDEDCESGEFCDLDDNVCRPEGDRPCDPDDFEPNDTRAEAEAGSFALPVPAQNANIDFPANSGVLTLCDNSLYEDVEDWFTITLTRGDLIQIRGASITGLEADMTAYGPDGITELDDGAIDDFAPDLLEFTADNDDTYFIRIESTYDYLEGRNSAGEYTLNITNSEGTPCDDAFETTHGSNNTADDASLLNDAGGVPADCVLTSGSVGSDHVVSCLDGAVNMCLGDVDYYLVDLHAGSSVEVVLSAFSGNLDLHLYGPFAAGETPSTAVIEDSSTSYSASSETVEGMVRGDSTYLVRVSRRSGDATTYELVATITSGPACTEDAYDDVTAAAAGTLPLPQLVEDPAGYNDLFAQASFIDIKHPNVGTPSEPKKIEVAPLSLCRQDADWFRLGTESAGVLVDIPAGIRVLGRLTNITKSNNDDGVKLKAGSTETGMVYSGDHPTEYLIMDTTGDPYYFLVVPDPGNTGVIDYTLEVEYIPSPTCAPETTTNDAPADATTLAAGGTPDWPDAIGESASEANISLCGSDIDWYKIAAPAGAAVLSSVRYDPLEADIGLALYDATVLNSTNLPGTADDLPDTGLLSESTFESRGFQRVRGGTGGGDIYIMVYNPSTWPLLDYTLEVELLSATCTADAYEPNEDWDAAEPFTLAPLTAGGEVMYGIIDLATMCDGDDTDWFTVPSVSIGDSVSVSYYLDPNEGDLDMYLYAPGPGGVSSYLDWDWDYYTGVATVSTTVDPGDPPGDYLVKIVPWGSGPFSNVYMLEALVTRSCVNDALEPSSPTSASALTVDTRYDNLKLCSEEDWYSFTGTGNPMTICAEFVHADGNIDLLAYADFDPAETVIGGAQSTTDNERVLLLGSAAGTTYYLRVYMPNVGNMSYDLTISDGTVACP